jgi:hypothetical protein
VAGAVPDNDSSSFLSHDMEPIQQMLRLWTEVQLEVAHRLTTV